MSSKTICDRKKYKTSSAQALIEVALLMPLLLLLVLGVLDFGRLFMTKFIITNAAREGANFLSYNPDKIAIANQVIKDEANSSGISVSDGEITIEDCCTQDLPVSVTVSKTVDLIYGDILQAVGLINGPITMTGKVQMMVLVLVEE